MVKEELLRMLEVLLSRLAPQVQANPLAGLMLTQLKGFMRSMPEQQAQEIATALVQMGKRLEVVLERELGADRPNQ